MNSKKELTIKILRILAILAFIALGILTIVYCDETREKTNRILGIILLVNAIPSVLLFFIEPRQKLIAKIISISLAVFVFTFGLVAIFNAEFPAQVLFIIWGSLDILRGVIEASSGVINFKPHPRSSSIKIVIGIADIVFGILLCIKNSGGLKGHLIFIAVSSFLLAIDLFVDLIIENKK